MINITEEYINAAAPNAGAVQNAWGLVRKNSFVKLYISPDETVIFGECTGSGKDNYMVSTDFIKPEAPVFRCTCPSRQFPCKHALGLMAAYLNGKKFSVSEIPEDIVEKREKAEKREIKKKEGTEPAAKKVNKSALSKKIKVQVEGLELLNKIVNDILKNGLGSIDAKSIRTLEDQARQLGDYYLPGVQAALREFILLFKNNEQREKVYTEAVNRIVTLRALSKKGIEYLNARLENMEIGPDKESSIEEWLGHPWQLGELKELGLVEEDAELIQLSFNSYTSEARQEYVDNGIWINLKDGKIYETMNYRPFKAAKYVKEDDSFFSAAQVKELYIYPGDMNRRVRWEEMTVRDIKDGDFAAIKSHAAKSLPEVIKAVKNQIKNPLSDKNPIVLLSFSRIGLAEGRYVMEDMSGNRLVLEDDIWSGDMENCSMFSLMKGENLHGQALLVRFHHNMENGRLHGKPLSIVTEKQIIRLIY